MIDEDVAEAAAEMVVDALIGDLRERASTRHWWMLLDPYEQRAIEADWRRLAAEATIGAGADDE